MTGRPKQDGQRQIALVMQYAEAWRACMASVVPSETHVARRKLELIRKEYQEAGYGDIREKHRASVYDYLGEE